MDIEFSIIIPVLFEGKEIISGINRLAEEPFLKASEIIIVDGDTEGSTISRVSDRCLKLTAPAGRGRQLNAGAAKASGRFFIFLHADTSLPENALFEVKRALTSDNTAAGAFDLRIDDSSIAFRIIEKAASIRSRITRIPYGDQVHFIRREIFFKIGGYPEIPVMEDVELMRKIKRLGMKIRILKAPVTTSARRWQKEGILRCTARNWFILTAYLMGASPENLAAFYLPPYLKHSGRQS